MTPERFHGWRIKLRWQTRFLLRKYRVALVGRTGEYPVRVVA